MSRAPRQHSFKGPERSAQVAPTPVRSTVPEFDLKANRSAKAGSEGFHAGHEQDAELFSHRAARSSGIPSPLASSRRSGGAALDDATKSHMGDLLGTDLSRVRVHSDSRSEAIAEKLGADALTVGDHIYFGAGNLRAGSIESDRLLAHELAHVAQQKRTGMELQPRLRLTGAAADRNRAIALLNSGLTLGQVSTDSTGQLSIRRTASGPLLPTEQVLYDRLSAIINDSHSVDMTVSSGSRTLVGSYATADIDIADIEMVGVGGIIHEIEEQYQRQVNSLAFGGETTGAHGEAIRTESAVTGTTRGAQRMISQSVNADGTIDAVVEIPYTSPDGTVRVLVMTISHNNVVGRRFR